MCEYNSNIIDRLIPPPPTNFDVGHIPQFGSLGGLCSMTRGAVAPLVCMLKKALLDRVTLSVTVVTIARALDNEKMSLCVAHARVVSRNMT